jgi:predicted lipid-binding transport protein (Tim44 family)
MVHDKFFEIQKAWCEQDRTKLAVLLSPDLLREWENELKFFKNKHMQNLMDRITVFHIHFVSVKRNSNQDSFTCSIDAGAVDYFQTDSGDYLSYREKKMPKEKLPFENFREFWTFQREGNKDWNLCRVDQEDDWSLSVNEPISNKV